MFQLMNYRQGYFILFAIIILVISCIQSYEANTHINRTNDENSDKYWIKKLQTAPFVSLIVAIVLLSLSIILPISPAVDHDDDLDAINDQYIELEDKYDGLKSEYDQYVEDIWSYEDDVATVYCYFDNDESISLEEASSAFERIKSIWTY